MKRKGFAALFILIGIILFLIVAGGAYYLGRFTSSNQTVSSPLATTPVPVATNPLTDWKTYSFEKEFINAVIDPNSVHKFTYLTSFKYPSSFTVKEEECKNNFSTCFTLTISKDISNYLIYKMEYPYSGIGGARIVPPGAVILQLMNGKKTARTPSTGLNAESVYDYVGLQCTDCTGTTKQEEAGDITSGVEGSINGFPTSLIVHATDNSLLPTFDKIVTSISSAEK